MAAGSADTGRPAETEGRGGRTGARGANSVSSAGGRSPDDPYRAACISGDRYNSDKNNNLACLPVLRIVGEALLSGRLRRGLAMSRVVVARHAKKSKVSGA